MKFKIENDEEKVIKTIRIPKSLNLKIEGLAKKHNVTFTKLVVEACLYALNNLEEK